MLPERYTHDVEQPMQVEISMTDGVFIKQIVIPKAGTYVPQHSHTYDHTSMLAVGTMRVWADGLPLGDFDAPKPIQIKAGVKHTMLAMTDGVVFYCIHNVARTGEVDELEHHEFPRV